MKKNEKYLHYAAQLSGKVAEIFDEESAFYIDPKELELEDNYTDFIHALANVMPTHLFNKFTNEDKNTLEFNHMANQLVFQYSVTTE